MNQTQVVYFVEKVVYFIDFTLSKYYSGEVRVTLRSYLYVPLCGVVSLTGKAAVC